MKIYFILNSISDAHSIKRISDFKGHGAEMRVFGFLRNKENPNESIGKIIGSFSNDLSYSKRIKIYYEGISKVFKKYKDKDILWYYLGLDVASIATIISPYRKYIYEECDLVHTSINNRFIFNLFERLDKYIIKRSVKTIFTSEGFMDFHYKKNKKNIPNNILLVENKLDKSILNHDTENVKEINVKHLRFAFAGGIRYYTLLNIADVIAKEFPQHEFHFYGFVSPIFKAEELPHRNNIFYHGRYKSPHDLPLIYKNTDIIVATYDYKNVNVRYAEPNKLYEAIYFRCPILVSSKTFLAQKVKKLNIGFEVDPYDDRDIISVVHRIGKELSDRIKSINKINKLDTISNINYVDDILKSLL